MCLQVGFGTPSTWNLDPSWDDGDRGGIPEEVTADGRSKCYQSEGSQGEHVPSRKTSSWKVCMWKGVCYFLCFWGNEKPEGLDNESKDGMVQNMTGHLCGVRSFMGHKSFSLWLKSTSKIFSRNLARLELERCFHINVWKAYWSWVMEEMGRLVWRLLSRQRWFCLEVEWWQWGWMTMGWRHSGGKTNSTRQWGGCRRCQGWGLGFGLIEQYDTIGWRREFREKARFEGGFRVGGCADHEFKFGQLEFELPLESQVETPRRQLKM